MKGYQFWVAAAVIAFAFSGAASAAPPLTGTTTNTLTSDVIIRTHLAGGNLIVDEEVFTASLSGTFTGISTFTIHGPVHADGSGQFQGTGTFTGTISGCGSVTIDFQVQFRIKANGDIVGTSGSIGPSPVTYHSTFVGSLFSPTFTETSSYHC
jgi:hypothetical protein